MKYVLLRPCFAPTPIGGYSGMLKIFAHGVRDQHRRDQHICKFADDYFALGRHEPESLALCAAWLDDHHSTTINT